MPLYGANPLATHRLFETTDPIEARCRVGALLCPHTLRIQGDPRDLGLAWYRAPLHSVELHYFRYGVEAYIDTVTGPSFLIELPLCGSGSTRHGDRVVDAVPGRAVVLAPRSTLHAEFSSDCAKLLIVIPELAIRQQLKQILGYLPGDALRFAPDIDLERGSGPTLHRTIEFILGEIRTLPPTQLSLYGLQLEQLLVRTLLTAHESNHSGAIGKERTEAEPAFVEAAERFMRAHLEEVASAADLACACGVSERALQAGFRRHRGYSATAALRDLRFTRARETLLAARRGTTSVASIATAFGFDELGRFAVEYRKRFGASPPATLRRA